MSNFSDTSNSGPGLFSQTSDLTKRILYTLLILIIYRFCTYVPIPGIDPDALKNLLTGNERSLLGMFNVFAGGAVQRMAILTLGIMPYISASIIIQLLTGVTEYFKNLKNQGEYGRRKITQYTRYGTVLLALIQGFGVSVSLENSPGLVLEAGMYFRLVTTITLLTGTILVMWLGEQITARGIGNGISLIIFSGIVAEIPRALASTFEMGRTGAISSVVILSIIFLLLGAIYFIVFFERAQRRILIQYPKRQMGNKMYGGESSYLPLKVNTAGVIPAIFASALLLLPITLSNFSTTSNTWVLSITSLLGQGKPLYMIFYAAGIVFFSFFYTSIIFNPTETSDNLKKHGGFVPGIRPGDKTAEFIESLLTKLTVIGSTYLVVICLLPEVLISKYPIPFYLGGTSLLIVVVVAMDTITQVQTRMMSAQYASLIKKTKFTK
jgi:preprotein translocase subunit SecY